MVKFFSSIGVDNPIFPVGSLAFATVLEIAAFVFLAGSLFYLYKKKNNEAQRMFFWGSVFGIFTFTFFSIGDQIFGDRFELLEHTLFLITILVSYGIFTLFNTKKETDAKRTKLMNLKGFAIAVFFIVTISVFGVAVVTNDSMTAIANNPQVLEPTVVADGLYRFDLPCLSTRSIWEASLVKFKEDHPDEQIKDIYTAPDELKNKTDNAVIYIVTE